MQIKGNYVIITHRSGKRTVLPVDTYNRRQCFKRVIGVLLAVLSMLVLTGAATTEGDQDKVIATVVMLALCSSLIICGVVFGISGTDAEDDEQKLDFAVKCKNRDRRCGK